MIVILLGYLVAAYVFSGLTCWLVFLRNFNHCSNLLRWQSFFAVLASSIIIISWPIWMIIDTQDLKNSTKAPSLTYIDSNSRFLQTQQEYSYRDLLE